MSRPRVEYRVDVFYPMSKAQYIFKDETKALDCAQRHNAKTTVDSVEMFTRVVYDWVRWDQGQQEALL